MEKMIENGVTVLIADEGMKLTNGESFGATVRLGVKDSEDNWREVTEVEAEHIQTKAEEVELTDSEALAIITGGAV